MKKSATRFLSLLLVLSMVVGMLPATALAAESYTVTVVDGTSEVATAEEGAQVRIGCDPPEGKLFSHWEYSDNIPVLEWADDYATNYFDMPAGDVTLTAVLETGCIVTVDPGEGEIMPDSGYDIQAKRTVPNGEFIWLYDGEGFIAPEGKYLDHWLVDGEVYLPHTEFTVTKDVTLVAQYEDIVFSTLTVVNGLVQGENGEWTNTLENVPFGMFFQAVADLDGDPDTDETETFTMWDGEGEFQYNDGGPGMPQTYLIMGKTDLTLTAYFGEIAPGYYEVTSGYDGLYIAEGYMHDIRGGFYFKEGETVYFDCCPPEGQRLSHWENTGIASSDLTAEDENFYSFTMPGQAVGLNPCFVTGDDHGGDATIASVTLVDRGFEAGNATVEVDEIVFHDAAGEEIPSYKYSYDVASAVMEDDTSGEGKTVTVTLENWVCSMYDLPEVTVTGTVNILHLNNLQSVTMANYSYKDEEPTPVVTYAGGTSNGGNTTFKYKGRGDTSSREYSSPPSQPGTYTVTATCWDTDTVMKKEVTADFEVFRLPLTLDRVYVTDRNYEPGNKSVEVTEVHIADSEGQTSYLYSNDYTASAEMEDDGFGKDKKVTGTIALSEDKAKYYSLVDGGFETTVTIMEMLEDFKYWEKADGTIEITDYTGDDTVVTVPATVNGQPVTSIGRYAFSQCETMTEVTLPDSITTIEASAFGGCTSLEELMLPADLTSIGDSAFYGCTSLGELTLPADLTSIGDSAFYGCTSLGELIVPDGVTSIEKSTFYGCTSLTSVALPEGVTSIAVYAFRNCSALETLRIPSGVYRLHNYTLTGCDNLRKLYIPETVVVFPAAGYLGSKAVIYTQPGSNAESYALNSGLEVRYGGFDLGDIYLTFAGGSYQGTMLKLYEGDTLVQEKTIPLTTGQMLLSGLDPHGTFRVELYNGKGSLIGEEENIQLTKDVAPVTLTLPEPETVALTVTAEGRDITKNVSIAWMDGATALSTDAMLKGVLSGDTVTYQISLDEEQSQAYKTPAKGTYTVVDGENTVEVALVPRGSAIVNGTVTCDSEPVSGATVALTQQLGRHTLQETVMTDDLGNYTLTVYEASGRVEISRSGCISQIIPHASDLTQAALSAVALEAVTWGTISLDITQQRAVDSGVTAVPTALHSGADLKFDLYNVTQNKVVTQWAVQFPDIVLLESVSNGDALRITATDTTGRLETAITTVVVQDNGAQGTLALVEAGSISVVARQNQNAESVLILFDGDGDRVAQYDYRSAGIQTKGLPAGNYTLISMAKHVQYNAVQNLADFEALGLDSTSFVRSTAQVTSGKISQVTIVSIPLFVDDTVNHLDMAQSGMAFNKSVVTLGSAATLTTDIVFQEAFAQEISDVSLALTVSNGLSVVDGSVYLDGQAVAVADLDGKLTVPLGDGTAKKLHLTLSPNREGEHPITAVVNYTYDGQRCRSQLPLTQLTAQAMTVYMPEVVSEQEVVLSGMAVPNSTLRVYVNNRYNKALRVSRNGEWWTKVILPRDYATSAQYMIHLEGTIPGGAGEAAETFRTQPYYVSYQDGYPQVDKVTMYAGGQKIIYHYMEPGHSSNSYFSDHLGEVTFVVQMANTEEKMKDNPDWVSDVELMVTTLSGETLFLKPDYQDDGTWVATTDMTGKRVQTVSVDFETTAPMPADLDYLEDKSQEWLDYGDELSEEIVAESTINPHAEHMFITEKVQESPTLTRYDMYWFEDLNKTQPLGTQLVEELDYADYATADLESMGFVLTPHRESNGFYVCVELDEPDELRMLLVDRDLGKAYHSIQKFNWMTEEPPQPMVARSLTLMSDATSNFSFIALNKIAEKAASKLPDHLPEKLPSAVGGAAGGALAAVKAYIDTERQLELIDSLETELYNNEYKRRTEFNAHECESEDAAQIKANLANKTKKIHTFKDKAMDMYFEEYYSAQKILEYGIDLALAAGGIASSAFKAAWGYAKDAKSVYDSVTLGTLDEKLKTFANEMDMELARAYQEAYEACNETEEEEDDDGFCPRCGYEYEYCKCHRPMICDRCGKVIWYCTCFSDHPSNPKARPAPRVPRPIIDPSGYVYEAVPSNRIEGVTATVYTEETWQDGFGVDHMEIVQWDATAYDQENPLTTNQEGRYAWDVPPGQWQVKYQKDGYETTYSEWLTVPPPQTEVNIPMTSLEAPTVERVSAYTDGIEIVFSKYMDTSTLTSGNITVTVNDETVNGFVELVDSERNPVLDCCFASTIRFVPENPDYDPEDETTSPTLTWDNATEVDVTVNTNVKSYAAVALDSEYTTTDRVAVEPKSIDAPSQVTMKLGESETVTVDFGADNAAPGKILTISPSALFAVPTSVTVGSDGVVTFRVTANLPGSETLTVSLEGTALTADIRVTASQQGTVLPKRNLTGTVTITGDNTVGSTLTADYVGGPSGEHYDIYWLRNGIFCPVCKGDTWLLKESHVGMDITVEARAKGDTYTGSVFSENSVTVEAAHSGGSSGGGSSCHPTAKDTVTSNTSIKTDTLEKLLNQGDSLTVKGENGAAAVFDGKALEEIQDQSGNASVKIAVESTKSAHLNQAQEETVGEAVAYNLTATAGAKAITAFGSGTVAVTLPYQLKDGETAEGLAIYRVDEAGNREKVPATYDAKKQTISFATNHLALYMIAHEGQATWKNSFADVSETAWYYQGVKYAYMNDLMDGTSATTFAPLDNTTRSMVWTVLARKADTNLAGGTLWYSKAQEWAIDQDISDGRNPDDFITREQFVTMLWRNEGSPVIADYEGLAGFADVSELADYAQLAMVWAHAEGIIQGKTQNTLDPTGALTRAEMAVIFQRYLTAS